MAKKISKKARTFIAVTLFVIVYIALQLVIMSMERKGITFLNGVLTALQYGACLIIVLKHRKTGVIVSIIFLLMSILLLLRVIIFSGTMNALPGLFNAVFYLLTIVVIYSFYKRREIESITDVLTGLMNRRGLYNILNDKISNNEKFSLVYLCLDNFKFINDNYGHAYGDELMRKISGRMTKFIGKNGNVARIGGVEFAMTISGNLNAQNTANELLECIREKATIVVDDVIINCYMTCYAGISQYPTDSSNFEDIIKFADIAMSEAMTSKSQTAIMFDQKMAEYIKRQVELEHLIKDGLKRDYFYLVYQPQYHLDGKKLRGFETLIRMKTPDEQIVSPGEFIPVAEKGDLILQIDDYVLKRAMKEFKEIVDANNDLTISINVSAKNICSTDFPEKVNSIINETGFNPHNLEIEITEYCMVDSMDITIDNIRKLRDMGIQIALDDFGTGYTSLNYVAKLPINLLKVDKSLIDDIQKETKSREFVHAVISMGHLMGCEVISEGVEEDNQIDILRQDGCDFVQGFVWGKPLDYEVAKELSSKK